MDSPVQIIQVPPLMETQISLNAFVSYMSKSLLYYVVLLVGQLTLGEPQCLKAQRPILTGTVFRSLDVWQLDYIPKAFFLSKCRVSLITFSNLGLLCFLKCSSSNFQNISEHMAHRRKPWWSRSEKNNNGGVWKSLQVPMPWPSPGWILPSRARFFGLRVVAATVVVEFSFVFFEAWEKQSDIFGWNWKFNTRKSDRKWYGIQYEKWYDMGLICIYSMKWYYSDMGLRLDRLSGSQT